MAGLPYGPWYLPIHLGASPSPCTIPGNVSGNLLIGTVDKNDGVSARDIAPGEGGVEPEAKDPEHRVHQNSCQDLYGRKDKHGSVIPGSTRLESLCYPHLQTNSRDLYFTLLLRVFMPRDWEASSVGKVLAKWA